MEYMRLDLGGGGGGGVCKLGKISYRSHTL